MSILADENYLFVIGGKGAEEEKKVELVNLDLSNPCFLNPRDLPENVEGSVSAYIDNAIEVCGGHEENHCWSYNPNFNTW